MDKAAKINNSITLLFDTFSNESRNLFESFQNAGYDFTAAVIDDDGFLPDGVISAYVFFLGIFQRRMACPVNHCISIR